MSLEQNGTIKRRNNQNKPGFFGLILGGHLSISSTSFGTMSSLSSLNSIASNSKANLNIRGLDNKRNVVNPLFGLDILDEQTIDSGINTLERPTESSTDPDKQTMLEVIDLNHENSESSTDPDEQVQTTESTISDLRDAFINVATGQAKDSDLQIIEQYKDNKEFITQAQTIGGFSDTDIASIVYKKDTTNNTEYTQPQDAYNNSKLHTYDSIDPYSIVKKAPPIPPIYDSVGINYKSKAHQEADNALTEALQALDQVVITKENNYDLAKQEGQVNYYRASQEHNYATPQPLGGKGSEDPNNEDEKTGVYHNLTENNLYASADLNKIQVDESKKTTGSTLYASIGQNPNQQDIDKMEPVSPNITSFYSSVGSEDQPARSPLNKFTIEGMVNRRPEITWYEANGYPTHSKYRDNPELLQSKTEFEADEQKGLETGRKQAVQPPQAEDWSKALKRENMAADNKMEELLEKSKQAANTSPLVINEIAEEVNDTIVFEQWSPSANPAKNEPENSQEYVTKSQINNDPLYEKSKHTTVIQEPLYTPLSTADNPINVMLSKGKAGQDQRPITITTAKEEIIDNTRLTGNTSSQSSTLSNSTMSKDSGLDSSKDSTMESFESKNSLESTRWRYSLSNRNNTLER